MLGHSDRFLVSTALAQRIADTGFQVVIADEAHYLKNRESARAKLILPVLAAASRTILLTGSAFPASTPIPLSLFLSLSQAFVRGTFVTHRSADRITAPALNCPQELYSLVHTLDEETFPDWKEYAERYCDRKL